MFGFKKRVEKYDEYAAVTEIAGIILAQYGVKEIPKSAENDCRAARKGAQALWKIYQTYILSDKRDICSDMEQMFAGLDVNTAKSKVDVLIKGARTLNNVPYRILGSDKRYLISFLSKERMAELKKTLKKYNGAYDGWFDFDIYNMIKLPETPEREKVEVPPTAPKKAMVKIPPTAPDAKIRKSMEAIVRAVFPSGTEEKLSELRENLSKEKELAEGRPTEQAYWQSLLSAIDSQYVWLQDDFDADTVVEEISYLVEYNLDLEEDIDFSEFYVPKDAGTYKALSILAEELEERGVLLGLLESPEEKHGIKGKDFTIYLILAIPGGDKKSLEKLFADCGGAIHFDFNDAKQLAMPVRETGVLIDWGGPRLPGNDE